MSQERPLSIPRLNQRYLCKSWHLEGKLILAEVADQIGHITKPCCKDCLDKIIGEDHAKLD